MCGTWVAKRAKLSRVGGNSVVRFVKSNNVDWSNLSQLKKWPLFNCEEEAKPAINRDTLVWFSLLHDDYCWGTMAALAHTLTLSTSQEAVKLKLAK